MGRIPLKNPRSAALLPTWKKQPGMLGVRVEGWPTDGTADWFWPAAEKAGLPVIGTMTARSTPASSINGTSFSMVNGSGIFHSQTADSAFQHMDLRVNNQALARRQASEPPPGPK